MSERMARQIGTHRNFHNFIRNAVTIGAGVGFASFITLSNGVFVDEVRKRYQLYDKNGSPKNMDNTLAELCVNTLQEVRIPHMKKLKSKFFYVNGTEIFSAGSYEMKGVVIGIPISFTFNSVDDINKDLIRTPASRGIDWQSVSGEQLLQSMVLSEDAKKFAIAKEMYFVNNVRPVILAFVATFCCLIPMVANELYTKGKARSLSSIFTVYVLSITLATVKYFMLEEICSGYYNSQADKLAAGLNEQYRKGAIEYYKKKVMANKAWRELLGEEGKKLYTESGDGKSWKISDKFSQKLKRLELEETPNNEHLDDVCKKRLIQ